MNRKIFFVFIVTLLGYGSAVFGSSLERILSHVYQSDPRLLAERASLEATAESLGIFQADYRPDLSLSGSYGATNNNYDGQGTKTARSHSKPGELSATLTQKLLDPKYGPGYRKTEADIRAAQASLFDIEQTVLFGAIEAYINLYAEMQGLEVQRASKEFMDRNLEAVQIRYDAGDVTLTDLSQAKSHVAESDAELAIAEGKAVNAKATYIRRVGLKPSNTSKILLPKNLPTSDKDFIQEVLKNNPKIKKVQAEEDSARASLEVQRSAFLPSVALSASAGHTNEGRRVKYRSDTASIKATLTMPFDLSGKLQAQFRQAHNVLTKAMFQHREAQRELKQESLSLWEEFSVAKKRYRAFGADVRQATFVLEGVQVEEQAGSRNVIDVLEARKRLLKAQLEKVRAYKDIIIIAYNILRQKGALTARDLSLPVDYYDPNNYVEEIDGKWWGLGSALEKPKSFSLNPPPSKGKSG